ncbi:MAG: hypothetical protein MZV64_29045 [Ignavibacteriales bacterium]|nr:hypothetical protein [Ignavibacteriales bacterium]
MEPADSLEAFLMGFAVGRRTAGPKRRLDQAAGDVEPDGAPGHARFGSQRFERHFLRLAFVQRRFLF